MSAAVLVAVLVAAGEAQAPATVAIQAAAAEVLGAGSVVVRESATPSDSEVLRVEEQLQAAAVVALRWSDTVSAYVHVRIHVAREDRWIDREMAFLAADTMPERGRTIGFAIASMLLSQTEAATPPVEPKSVAPGPGPTATADSVAMVTPKYAPDEPREQVPPSRAVDLSVVGSRGLGGPASGVGGAARIEFLIARTFWLRAGAAIRTGSVPRLNGNDIVASAALGVAWRPYPTTRTSPFGGGIRLDAGILFHDLSHRAIDGTAAHQNRLMPGATLAVEGTWRLTGSLDAVFALGSEMAFGATEVLVAGHPVATIPMLRGLAELGARICF